MLFQRRKLRSFGADDKPVCPKCNNPTSLTRRSPDADYGLRYEHQTFACHACGQLTERIVDEHGNALK